MLDAGLSNSRIHGTLSLQQLRYRRFQRISGETEVKRRGRLAVEVYQQSGLFGRGQTRGQVYGGGRLAHTTFVVEDRQNHS